MSDPSCRMRKLMELGSCWQSTPRVRLFNALCISCLARGSSMSQETACCACVPVLCHCAAWKRANIARVTTAMLVSACTSRSSVDRFVKRRGRETKE